MKRTYYILLLLFTCFGGLMAQENTPKVRMEVIEGPKPWNHLEFNDDPRNFQFAIVTDRTGGHRPGIFSKGLKKLNLLKPEFVVSIGDLIEGYTEDVDELNRQWDEFEGFIDLLEAPFFYLPGNHDITNKVMEKVWKERFGPTYYHFIYHDVLFLCLNTEDDARGSGRGTIMQPQLDYIKKVLEENQDVRWTMVFMHQPLWSQNAPNELWPEVEKLLEGRKHNVYVGHHHRYVRYERNNGIYTILATTGGASGLRGPSFGEFDHVVWITMTDEGPIMANLLLEGIWEEDVVTDEWADIMKPLAGSSPMRVEPVFTDSETFSGETMEVRLTNDSDYPMEVAFRMALNEKLTASGIPDKLMINPNSVELLSMKIASANSVSLKEVSPIKLMSSSTYRIENQPEIVMEQQVLIRPAKSYEAKEAEKEVVVDGSLEEWNTLRQKVNQAEGYVQATPFSHSGDEDLSFTYDVSTDNEYLYVGIEIHDDDLNLRDDLSPSEKDCISVLLDARPTAISANGRGYDYRDMLAVNFGLSEKEGETFIHNPHWLPKGTKAVCKKVGEKVVGELAIPMSYVTSKNGQNWKNFRLNVAVTDFDKDFMHQSALSWQPDWRGEDSYLGSGMYIRSPQQAKAD
ncbi:MAG: metallophosphoesterase [Bacteroidota bacterium]